MWKSPMLCMLLSCIVFPCSGMTRVKCSFSRHCARSACRGKAFAASPFVDVYREAIAGNATGLESLLSIKCRIKSPIFDDKAAMLTGMKDFSNFFIDPDFMVENQIEDNRGLTVIGKVSFTYPLPWRPRVIVPINIKAVLDEEGLVTTMHEKWDVSFAAIFFKQILPRFWDAWHLFSSVSPEYPPIKTLCKRERVSIVRLPSTMMVETTWYGLAQYEGPPIMAVPGFCWFGSLPSSSQAGRQLYQASLPVEVLASKFTSPTTGRAMKATTWRFHVSTALQRVVMDRARSEHVTELAGDSLLNSHPQDDDDDSDDEEADGLPRTESEDSHSNTEADVRRGGYSTLRNVTGGALRSNFVFDRAMAEDYEANQKVFSRYRMLPSRLVAQVKVPGEVTAQSIAEALGVIRTTLAQQKIVVDGKRVRLRDDGEGCRTDPLFMETNSSLPASFGLQQWDTKACFNFAAEPAMAVYEMQYNLPSSTLFVDIKHE